MNIVRILKKFSKYIDQGFYSLCTLLLSLLAPVFFSNQESAEILYLISFLLLFMAATTAIFTTQMLSIYDKDNQVVEKIFRMFIGTSLIVYLITLVWHITIGLENPFFFYFAYLFCTIDFFRRMFIRQGKDNWSLYLSTSCLIIVTSSYFIANIININFWQIAFFLSLTIVLPSYYFYIKNFRCKVLYEIDFIKRFVKNGILALASFGLAWAATQGIFVTLYDSVGSSIFVEQKLIFSILGFFNIIMIVQENKYQPLYAAVVLNENATSISKLDKLVNTESHILFIVCIVLFLIFYIVNLDFYLSFLIFSIYRYFFGLSKKNIYYFRAIGRYQYLLISNLLSLIILGVIYVFANDKIYTDYIIPICFLMHSIVFLFTSNFFKLRNINEKYWNI